ncbi:MAG: hypothetical protein AAF685_10640 [Cyanobacteria bacterium P01_C01_bin.89]
MSSSPTVQGVVGPSNPIDVYRFNLGGAGTVEVSTNGTTATTTTRLYEDINRNQVIDNGEFLGRDVTSSGQVDVLRSNVGAGDYLVVLEAPSDGRTTPYRLSFSGPAGASLGGGATPPPPPAGSANGTVNRYFDFLTGTHFYTANAAEQAARSSDSRYRFEGASFDSGGPNTVERFFNNVTGTYFYTINPAERDAVILDPNYTLQSGLGFNSSANPAPGFIPVFRFFNTTTGVHFYTPNPQEAQTVRATLPGFRDEGVGFYADPLG